MKKHFMNLMEKNRHSILSDFPGQIEVFFEYN